MELTHEINPLGSLAPLTPHLIVGALIILAFVLELFRTPDADGKEGRPVITIWAPLGCLAALLWVVLTPLSSATSTMHHMFIDDGLSRGAEAVILISMILGLLAISSEVLVSGFLSEYVALILCAGLGMGLMAAAENLMMIFLGLEIFSLALYLLCIFLPERKPVSSISCSARSPRP